ncbi:MAG: glycine--tRNA ligase subunit beta [Bacillota bacterium]
MARDLLLEIGTEEIPARFMEPALSQLKEMAEKKLAELRLEYARIATYGTPRRLTIYIYALDETQKDQVNEVKGPPFSAAYDTQSQPTKAAAGFARSQGVAVEDLIIKKTPTGDYVFAVSRSQGQPAMGVLPSLLISLILGLTFPKPMRWGEGDMRFARPIRWLVALFGSEVVDLELEGLTSGRLSRGHRFLAPGDISLPSAGDYLEKMEEGFVIANPQVRRHLIWEQIQEVARNHQGLVRKDEELLDEVTYLLEYPTALCGGFEEKYLQLPREGVITPMREHQRYFPVEDAQGNLLPLFITVRNGNKAGLNRVREGNEKVLRARLADAEFFYREDIEEPLISKVDRLKNIVFQESLGTLYQKVERIRVLVAFLGNRLGVAEELRQRADRAACLAKADLVTNMVYEFPELQGIMGGYYALSSGENGEVAKAVSQHYRPRFAGDTLPENVEGALVSMADKMDNIAGCFALGFLPTGSQDPYALRRQALGICHILLERQWNVSLKEVLTKAYTEYKERIQAKLTGEEFIKETSQFFRQRLENILAEIGYRYDVIEAVLAVNADDPVDVLHRAAAVAEFRQSEGFKALLTGFNRAANLSRNASPWVVEPRVFQEEVEHRLYQALERTKAEAELYFRERKYLSVLSEMANLREPIDRFFEGVLVMAEDEQVRNNRLAMLKDIATFLASVADLSRIVL